MPDLMTSGETQFVERQLMDQSRDIYDQALPPLHALELFPPSGQVASGAAQFNRRIWQLSGVATWMGASNDDIPESNAGVIEDVYNVDFFNAAYSYSLKEIKRAMFGNQPLERGRAMASKRAMDEFINDVGLFGSEEKDITGLYTIAYIPRISIDASLFQIGADTEETLAALHQIENQVELNSNQTYRPDLMTMPVRQYQYINDTFRSTTSDLTILQAFLRNSRHIKKVVPIYEAAGAGANGEDVISVLSTAPDMLEHNVPDLLSFLEPQYRGTRTIRIMYGETAGMISQYPGAHVHAELS